MWTLAQVRELAANLEAELDNLLHSVVAYRDPYDKSELPWKILVVLRDATPEVLRTVGTFVGPGADRVDVFRYDELLRGADVLGLFLWTIDRRYVVCTGPDPIDDIRPRTASLRLLLELRLRQLQLRTRQLWMAADTEHETRRHQLGKLCLDGRELTRMAEAILGLQRTATPAQELHLRRLTATDNVDATPEEVDRGFDLLFSILEKGVAEVDRY